MGVKQQILEVLDKSTNNGMKADEIMQIARDDTLKYLDEFFTDYDDEHDLPLVDHIKIYIVGRLQ